MAHTKTDMKKLADQICKSLGIKEGDPVYDMIAKADDPEAAIGALEDLIEDAEDAINELDPDEADPDEDPEEEDGEEEDGEEEDEEEPEEESEEKGDED